jgi:hypothetical protein
VTDRSPPDSRAESADAPILTGLVSALVGWWLGSVPALRDAGRAVAAPAAWGRRIAATLARRVRANLPLVLVAVGVGAVVWFVATEVFPYHSVNDDEAVYLTQAALLLDGQLFIRPGPFGNAVRPWFFVADQSPAGLRYYSKYTPVAAAVFAGGLAVGTPRLSLAVVAAVSAALVGVLVGDAFDRPTGIVAAASLAASPLFVFSSSVFLSYAPTTAANLAFAVAYVRSYRARTGRHRTAWAALAGGAAGIAFFTRSYTAVLFAAPFILHTASRLVAALRSDPTDRTAVPSRRRTVVRAGTTAAVGLALVGVTLAYNARVTGSPFVFPYQAFGPNDGLGFGYHQLLGYEEVYTPAMAVETTTTVLRRIAAQWGPAGPVGTLLALVGLASLRRGWWPSSPAAGRHRSGRTGRTDGGAARDTELSDWTLRVLLVGVAVSVVLGEAYFWGTLNGLRNGLIDLLGPYYHFDLLVPLAAFAAAGGVRLWRRLRTVAGRRLSPSEVRGVLLVAALVAAAVVGAATATAMAPPVEANSQRTAALETTYEPFADAPWEPRVGTDSGVGVGVGVGVGGGGGSGDPAETAATGDRSLPGPAVVFLPSPYGDWLGHPFQVLRNGPDLGGSVLYLIDDPPDDDLRALAATNRTPYRFTYRGTWQGATTGVDPELTRLRVLDGERIAASTTVGVPQGAQSASIRLETTAAGSEADDGPTAAYARYTAAQTGETLTVDWSVTPEGVAVGSHDRAAGPARVPLAGDASEVVLLVTFVDESGASVTYRQELTVGVGRFADGSSETVRVVWPPETRVCRLRTDCGREATWIGPDGDYLDGVSVEMAAEVVTPSE